MNVFIANAEMAYEMTQILGVRSDLDAAVTVCNERPYPGETDEHGSFDRWWVEEWTVDGDFIAQYDVIDKVVSPPALAALSDG